MWEFLMGIFIGRATGLSRYVKSLLFFFAVGVFIAGLIYTYVFLNAAIERSHDPHVHAHSTH
jgi:hypothetical protein